MKLPSSISSFLGAKPPSKEYLFSLVLDVNSVVVAAWYLASDGQPRVAGWSSTSLSTDSWEERIEATDRLLTAVEDEVKVERAIQKTVLGLPCVYLSPEGNIDSSVRPQIKKIMNVLDLSPVGFVALPAALAYSLKKEEGVPPSIILIGVSGDKLAVSLYRVGQLLGQEIIPDGPDSPRHLEEILKKFQDHDVLPSRMLLYGASPPRLEEIKNQLLKHPWPTRANFLHYPKIEAVTSQNLAAAVSLAGATELAQTLAPELEESLEVPKTQEAVAEVALKTVKKEEVVEETGETEEAPEVEPNVEQVAPEALGFKKEDVLEKEPIEKPPVSKEEALPRRLPSLPKLPKLKLPTLPLAWPTVPTVPKLLLVLIGVGVLFFGWLLYYSLPRATVTILVQAKTLDSEAVVTVDPSSTVVDPTSKTLPGRKLEKTVSGEKTIPVSGKKDIGDPARGAVTIYNKTTSERIFKKGTVLSRSGLTFTLDDEVKVASASESVGSITFGKTNAAITAAAIGPQSNLPSGSEFSFKDVATSMAVARNDQPLTGGTSREVQVVSRADYDSLVTALTNELVGKAKTELASSVSGSERLIDATVKTGVVEKSFDQELDQEAKEVHGKVTIAVSGLSYGEDELKQLLSNLVVGSVPQGYSFSPERATTEVKSAQVKKDGKVVLAVSFGAVALPEVDTAAVGQKLAGASVEAATEILRAMPGVAGVEFSFRWTPFQNRLPIKQKNISLSVAVQ